MSSPGRVTLTSSPEKRNIVSFGEAIAIFC